MMKDDQDRMSKWQSSLNNGGLAIQKFSILLGLLLALDGILVQASCPGRLCRYDSNGIISGIDSETDVKWGSEDDREWTVDNQVQIVTDTCCEADTTNWYTYPSLPRRTTLADDGQQEFYSDQVNHPGFSRISTFWVNEPFEPILLVITHENFATGKIYGSEYVMVVRGPQGSIAVDKQTILDTTRPAHIIEFCNWIFNSGSEAWQSPQQGMEFYYMETGSAPEEMRFGLNRFEYPGVPEFLQGTFPMCAQDSARLPEDFPIHVSVPGNAWELLEEVGACSGAGTFACVFLYDPLTHELVVSPDIEQTNYGYSFQLRGNLQIEILEIGTRSCLTTTLSPPYSQKIFEDESVTSYGIDVSDSSITELTFKVNNFEYPNSEYDLHCGLFNWASAVFESTGLEVGAGKFAFDASTLELTFTDITSYPTDNIIVKIGAERGATPVDERTLSDYYTFDIQVFACSDHDIVAPDRIFKYSSLTGIDLSDNTVDTVSIRLNRFTMEYEEFCGIYIDANLFFQSTGLDAEGSKWNIAYDTDITYPFKFIFTEITSYPAGNLIVTIKAWKAQVAIIDRDLDNPVQVQFTVLVTTCIEEMPTITDTDSISQSVFEYQFSTTENFYEEILFTETYEFPSQGLCKVLSYNLICIEPDGKEASYDIDGPIDPSQTSLCDKFTLQLDPSLTRSLIVDDQTYGQPSIQEQMLYQGLYKIIMKPVGVLGATWPLLDFIMFDIIIKAEEVDKNVPSYSKTPQNSYDVFAGDYQEIFFESIIFENEEEEVEDVDAASLPQTENELQDTALASLLVNGEDVISELCIEECPVYFKDASNTTLVMQASDTVFDLYSSEIVTKDTEIFFIEFLMFDVTIILRNSLDISLKTEYQLSVQIQRFQEKLTEVVTSIEEEIIVEPQKEIEIIKKSTKAQNQLDDADAVTKYIAKALNVEEPQKVIQSSQLVIEVSDDTDLEKAAQFDFIIWLEEKGLINVFDDIPEDSPQEIKKLKLRDTFAVPEAGQMSKTGDVNIKFSSEVVIKDFKTLLPQLAELKNSTFREFEQDFQLPIDEKMISLTKLLKISESIHVELVPGDDNYLDKKAFEWELSAYSEKQMSFKFNFAHPLFISVGALDTFKVTFYNAEVLISPNDPSKLSIPDSFILVFKIPPQGVNLMSSKEVEAAKQDGQAFVIFNLLFRTAFKSAMSALFGSIIMIQILAHLPLADIILPANAHQMFDIMIGIVSFDFFQPLEYFDLGFTDMPFWSENFDWLGYGSINFVDGMGSIIIFALVQILQGLIVLCLLPVKSRIKSKTIGKRCSCKEYRDNTEEFINGTFFEILICVSISMQMLKFRDFLNASDWVSVVFSFFFAVLLLAQIIFMVQFTIFKSKDLVTLMNQQREEKTGIHQIEEIHNSILLKIKKTSSSKNIDAELKTSKKFLKQRRKNKLKKMKKKAKKINKDKFKIYEPLVEGLRHDSRAALFNNLMINFRRLSLLYLVMSIEGHPWIQILSFMVQNLVSLAFLIAVRPYDTQFNNYLNIFNEVISLLVAYLIVQANDQKYEPLVKQQIGVFIVKTIYFSWAVNFSLISILILFEFKEKIRIYYLTKLRWKYAYLRPKITKKLPEQQHQEDQLFRISSDSQSQKNKYVNDEVSVTDRMMISADIEDDNKIEVEISQQQSQFDVNQEHEHEQPSQPSSSSAEDFPEVIVIPEPTRLLTKGKVQRQKTPTQLLTKIQRIRGISEQTLSQTSKEDDSLSEQNVINIPWTPATKSQTNDILSQIFNAAGGKKAIKEGQQFAATKSVAKEEKQVSEDNAVMY